VDLSAELRRTLLDLQDERLLKAFSAGESSIAQDFIFPSKTGGVLDPDNMIRDRFLPLLQAAGIRAIRFHDLRHTFGSRSAMAGVDLPTLKELMGHSDISTTMRYIHPTPEHKVEALKKLEKFNGEQVAKERKSRRVPRKVPTVKGRRHERDAK
jgi:integrase